MCIAEIPAIYYFRAMTAKMLAVLFLLCKLCPNVIIKRESRDY